jgi:hypothetical protein
VYVWTYLLWRQILDIEVKLQHSDAAFWWCYAKSLACTSAKHTLCLWSECIFNESPSHDIATSTEVLSMYVSKTHVLLEIWVYYQWHWNVVCSTLLTISTISQRSSAVCTVTLNLASEVQWSSASWHNRDAISNAHVYKLKPHGHRITR